MKMDFKNIKKKSILFLILLLTLVVVGGTIAYFSGTGIFKNEFTTSKYKISIEEEFYNDWGTKKVSIVNKDSVDVVLRVSYDEIWTKLNEDSNTIDYLSNKIYDSDLERMTDVVTKLWTDDWENNFIDGHDGWYYYKKVLKANSNVQILSWIDLNVPLLEDNSVYEEYSYADYELVFKYEAAQLKEEAIKELWGLDVSIENGNITWPFN